MDLILGLAWLKRLGDVIHNWDQGWMKFLHQGSPVCLQDASRGLRPQAALHQWLQSPTRTIPSSTAVTLLSLQPPDHISPLQQAELFDCCQSFPSVFAEPQGLPPSRKHDHKIVLLAGAELEKISREGKLQKMEIEKQVRELLSLGMIRPSTSAFSSPVILVRKKDDSWRMCVDYRALNKATVPDKFPIPIVDELLDELHGATVFSKLDLKSGSSWETHLLDLAIVLRILSDNQFGVNAKKCFFGKSSIEYLGHIIDGTGVAMDPTKIEAVVKWPTPANVKGVQGFLGLTGYYRKFVHGYGSIARPLTDITKKDVFLWNANTQTDFDALKDALVSAPVLALPDFHKPFVVECDASSRGIGAVLMQNKKSIAFFSKALSDRNLAKSAYEREIMALVLVVQHWRSYLLGTSFVVYNDQRSLKYLLQQRITTPDQQNWVAKLLGYNFDILYKSGRENRAADALSRWDEYGDLQALVSEPIWVQGAQLLAEAKQDQDIINISQLCQTKHEKVACFSLRNGVLYYQGRLVISRHSKFITLLLHEFHVAASGGHSGVYRTYRRLAGNLYWSGMSKTVKQYVRSCDICQRCKASSLVPGGLLQPLEIPKAIWEHLSIDFIVGLPKSKGYDTILVVVDRLSKYSHFILLKHPYSARTIADLFVKEVIRHHGIPKTIVSDRDPLFLSNFWKEIFKSQGTQLHMSSAYHPEFDGQTEVINRCLETYLRCCGGSAQAVGHLDSLGRILVQLYFSCVHGSHPVRIGVWSQTSFGGPISPKRIKNVDISFSVGEWVYVKLKPYRQMSVTKHIYQKLAPKFFGHFQIRERIGPVAYKLTLAPTSKIHPVFHVSLLKKTIPGGAEASFPDGLDLTPDDIPVPQSILASRQLRDKGELVEQWLIHWQGQTEEEATWENADLVRGQFPESSLEVKTFTEGGSSDAYPNTLLDGMDKPKIMRVYSKRPKVTEGKKGAGAISESG
ncbi:hypothetical protein LXL04_007805 [Taraxacum kok-saghyz]